MPKVDLTECACGLVITSPRPTVQEIGAYYPQTYYSYCPIEPTLTRRFVDRVKAYKGRYPTSDRLPKRLFWKMAAMLTEDWFLFHLPYQGKGRKLLEIGCGSGFNLRWAKDHGWDVYGLELSEQATAEAHRRGLENVRRDNIESATFPDGLSFDAILIYHTLEHLYCPQSAIRRCYELLRPGGMLLVGVPKFDSWPRHVLGEYWGGLEIPRHLYHFSEPVLSKMIASAGFRIREVRHFSRLVAIWFTLRTLIRFRKIDRLFTRQKGTIADVMLVVAEKASASLLAA
jgi:SAM-dependent methyltransferase